MYAGPPADSSLAGLSELLTATRPAAASFEDFYALNHARAVGFAYLLTRSHPAAQDLVQDAMMSMHKRWHRIDNPDAYLRRALVNNGSRWRSRLKREQEYRPVAALVTTDRVDEMWDALGRLPHKQRVAITLRYYADLSYPEIAELMNVPEGTVKSAIARALETLRKAVSR